PPQAQHKAFPHKQPPGTRHPRELRKRETREEYAARHARSEKEKTAPQPAKIEEAWDHSVFKVPVIDGKSRFHDFHLPPELMHSIYDLKFQYCTPVQAQTLAKSLAGEDVTAQAQTGTGKTAAFLITIFDRFLKNPIDGKRPHGTPRALILAPTRELAMQIEKDARDIGKYVPCSILTLVGGIDYAKQQQSLRTEPCDVLICTPGRLIDFKKKRLVDLGKVEILILDEADRMLDMGFIPQVRSIVLSTPPKARRQTMFFSATMSTDVRRLADSWTRQAVEVNITPDNLAVESVEQITYITTSKEKVTLLYNLIMQKNLERVLIFANRRDEARRLKETLETYGVSCALLSGEVDQQQRIRRLERFREGKVRVLVATDVASRGLHVEAISHVINYNLPQDTEDFVHRIGRTGRAGASGISISFADEYDSYELPKLEEFLGKKVQCVYPDENLLVPIPEIYQRITHKESEGKGRHRQHRPPRKPEA
ncbi:MAG TPA: DEAD/DEAH box helicase, partial [Bacteroidota bacterium]